MCRFSAEGGNEIDYKDINLLKIILLKLVKLYQAVLLVLKLVSKDN